jgi:hypothetical protein
MSTFTNETGLVEGMRKRLKKEFPGIWMIKVHGGPFQAAGVPDLIGTWRGVFFGIEAKHQKEGESEMHARERATPLQRVVIRQINQAGGTAGVALTPDEAVDIVRRAVKKATLAWGGVPDEGERDAEVE